MSEIKSYRFGNVSRSAFWLPFLALSAFCGFTLQQLHTRYLAKQFAFHDLALINDFLGSLFNRGKVFEVADLGVNHLSWHFTPSLFLVTPLYGIFGSQF